MNLFAGFVRGREFHFIDWVIMVSYHNKVVIASHLVKLFLDLQMDEDESRQLHLFRIYWGKKENPIIIRLVNYITPGNNSIAIKADL